MSVVLREYQQECLDSISKGYAEGQYNQLVSMATSLGKTICFSSIPGRLGLKGTSLVLAHQDTLLAQGREEWLTVNPTHNVGLEQGSNRLNDNEFYDCIVASMASLKGKRLQDLTKRPISLIVIDEAHRALCASYQNILSTFECLPPNNKILVVGFTATPWRSDKKDLADTFPYLAYDYPLIKALENNWWAPVKEKCIYTNTDISGVHMSGEDYNQGELEDAINVDDRNKEIFTAWKEWEGEKCRTLVFASGIAHADAIRDEFLKNGVKNVESINAGTPNREEVFSRLKTLSVPTILSNIGLVLEGVNISEIDFMLFAAPTQFSGRYIQRLGRGIRLREGKPCVKLLEMVDKGKPPLTLSTLLSLPRGYDFEGKDLLETKLKVDTLLDDNPSALAAAIKKNPLNMSSLLKCFEDMCKIIGMELIGGLKHLTDLTWSVHDVEALMGDLNSAEHYVLRIPYSKPYYGGSFQNSRTYHLELRGSKWVMMCYCPSKEKAKVEKDICDLKEEIKASYNSLVLKSRLYALYNAYDTFSDGLVDVKELYTDLAGSVNIVDDIIRENYGSSLALITRSAPWRSRQPGEKQLAFAKRLGIETVPGMSMGQLSELIDYQLRKGK